MTPYVGMSFSFDSEVILDSFSIFTPVGDSVIAKRVDKGCVVSVGGKKTLVDLFKLGMVDFYVILCMD